MMPIVEHGEEGALRISTSRESARRLPVFLRCDSRALLSLLRVGLPELKDRLELRKNRSLHSRIHCRLSIDPMTADDTADYVRLRLRRAGCERDLFAPDALGLLHALARSSLREIDREAARRSLGASSRSTQVLA